MSIKQLAKLAQTSIASVSRVINKRPGVNPEVRARVETLVEQHNFRPNLLARELLAKRTRTIGIILPTIHSYYADRIAGIMDVCREHKYGTLIASAGEDVDGEIENFNLFSEKQVEGIIFFAASLDQRHEKVLNRLGSKFPIVCIGQETGELPVSSILSDNYNGALLAFNHLAKLGHSKIAYVSGPRSNLSARHRSTAFEDSVKKFGWSVDPGWVQEGDFTLLSGYVMSKKLIEQGRPTAIAYGNDMMALGGLRALAELGLNCPKDISVIGFDDIPFAEYSAPALSTVHQNHYEIGKEAGKLMMAHLLSDGPPSRKVILEQELVVRESTIALRR